MKEIVNRENITALVIVIVGVILASLIGPFLQKLTKKPSA
jgi:hypothetical protein